MSHALYAMGIAAAILLPIVVFTVVISIAVVKRGEVSMGVEVHDDAAHAPATVVTATAKAGAVKTGPLVPRRALLSWMTLAWSAFTASMLAAATATGRFMFPNVLFEPPATF